MPPHDMFHCKKCDIWYKGRIAFNLHDCDVAIAIKKHGENHRRLIISSVRWLKHNDESWEGASPEKRLLLIEERAAIVRNNEEKVDKKLL